MIRRVTAEGGWREMSLLRSRIGDQAIRDVIESTEAGGTALGRQFGLGDMLAFYRKKYGVEDEGHVLVALAYFDDADRERTPIVLQRQSWPDVKATIRRWLAGATRGRR